MPDPISTIITAAIEHAPSTGAIVVAYKAVKPFLDKILGPGAEELGEMGRDFVKGKRAMNTGRTLADAAATLASTGREAQAVPLKVLEPLLNAASLEDEAALADKWAALLANAADPAQRVTVQPAFVEVLRQLTPVDARIVERVYAGVTADSFYEGTEPDSVIVEAYAQEMGLSAADFGVCMDNLLRLRLCAPRTRPFNVEQFSTALTPAVWVVPTRFGQAFLLACSPPTA